VAGYENGEEYVLRDITGVDTPLYPRKTALTALESLQEALSLKASYDDVEAVDTVYSCLLRAKEDVALAAAVIKKGREQMVQMRSFSQLELTLGRGFVDAPPRRVERAKPQRDDDDDDEGEGGDETEAKRELAAAAAR
jgi:hypothetical protein